jgi:hypothetical protein
MRTQINRLVVGFHGCDEAVAEAVIAGSKKLFPSTNKYDWLGSGVYFWENDWERAYEFAVEQSQKPKSKVLKPAVVGAIIGLGNCLDLTTRTGILLVEEMYSQIKTQVSLPKNKKGASGGATGDIMLRDLDRFVINSIHSMNEAVSLPSFDSVRAGFWEGDELYPNAGFRKKNHIQICVRNEHTVVGYFKPIP